MTPVQYLPDNTIVFEPRPLQWQKRGLMQTATGYGRKLTTRYMAVVGKRAYRVYATCFSNCASLWVTIKGVQYHLRESAIDRQ